MRARLSALALTLVAAAATPLAHADIYQFTYSGQQDSLCQFAGDCQTFTFQWQLSSTPDSYTATSFTYNSATLTNDSGLPAGPFYTVVHLATDLDSEAINFEDPDFGNAVYIFSLEDVPPPSFSTGPTSSPAFLPGTYTDASLYSDEFSQSFDGTAVITDLSSPPTTVTPEPSTFALLGTGVFGAAGLLRRRRLGQAT